jgi:hypothetical protein
MIKEKAMAQVVYANVEKIEDIGAAKWVTGDQDSYANTMKMADRSHGISLIGRKHRDGVSVCYAKTPNSGWRTVGAWHLILAGYLTRKLNTAPAGVVRAFFERIEDAAASNALVQLVALKVGQAEYTEFGPVHAAINEVGAELSALGVPHGDWSFIPMRNEWQHQGGSAA